MATAREGHAEPADPDNRSPLPLPAREPQTELRVRPLNTLQDLAVLMRVKEGLERLT
jgi:hypothetical protein